MNDVTWSSGNIFADIGLRHADEALFKVDLAIAIARIIEKRKLSQTEAATAMGLDQPKVSALVNGDVRGFSLDRLVKILMRLGQDIDIRVHPSKSSSGRVYVAA